MPSVKLTAGPFSERPSSVNSGPPIEQTGSFQHRSDMLMNEQIESVKRYQDALQRALADLDGAHTDREVRFHSKRVEELQKQTQQMVVMLQVCSKIDIELAYARESLRIALRSGSDITGPRQRVIWLEERMEKLLGARKEMFKVLASPRREVTSRKYTVPWRKKKHKKSKDDESAETSAMKPRTPADIRQQLSASQVTHYDQPDYSVLDHLRLARLNLLDRSSPVLEQEDTSITDELMSGLRSKQKIDDREKKEVDETEGKTEVDLAGEGEIGSVGQRESEADVEDKQDDGKEEDDRVESAVKSDREEEVDQEEIQPEDQIDREEEIEKEPQDEIDRASAEPFQETAQPEPLISREGSLTESSAGVGTPTVSSERSRPGTQEGEESRDSPEEVDDLKPTFLTESSYVSMGSQVSKTSHVTIKSPSEDFEEDRPPSIYALTREDFFTEHAQYFFNKYMVDLDPLSYHQMGLALPASFVKLKEENEEDVELPWRPKRRGSDITDIHKNALDKLSLRVHSMYEKVHDAAMKSVDPHYKEEVDAGPKLLQTMEKESADKEDDTSDEPKKKAGSKDSSSKEGIGLPSLTSGSGSRPPPEVHLKYYPKPIPPPVNLPLPKINYHKQYPKTSTEFSQSVPGEVLAAERIVDQRNLLQETKFTSSLFKGKVKAKTKSSHDRPVVVESPSPLSGRSRNIKTPFRLASAMVMWQKDALGNWKDLKPKSGVLEHSGLKWERVKDLVHNGLESPHVEARRDATKTLGSLRCGDTMVIYALKEKLMKDPDERVVYEAVRSLVSLGCWEENVLKFIVHFLTIGNTEVCSNLIKSMIGGKNVQFVDKSLVSFPEVTRILSSFCQNPDPADMLSFDAAVCLGHLCVNDDNAKCKLKRALVETRDTHIRAKAQEILIKQMNCKDADIVWSVMEQLGSSPVWKYRAEAARLLALLGPGVVNQHADTEQVYELLEMRLWDDPNVVVKKDVAHALAALDMFPRACEKVEKRLEDSNEELRAQAVISLGTLGIKSERIIRMLLEMLELDSSEYVRLMIIRTFASLKLTDKRILRILKEKEKVEGPLGRESGKTLRVLGVPAVQAPAQTSLLMVKAH